MNEPSPNDRAGDVLREVRSAGLRALADVTLPLGGLKVLIGDNGSGTSTIIEAFELLGELTEGGDFLSRYVVGFHGGVEALLRADASELKIGLAIDGPGGPVDYSFGVGRDGTMTVVTSEALSVGQRPVLRRDRAGSEWLDSKWGERLDLSRVVPAMLVDDVTHERVGAGRFELGILFNTFDKPVRATALSEGQLAYLALIALAELGKGSGFVAFDEPETHLHPQLLVRAAWLLEDLAAHCPVIVATQSNRLLDALSDPASQVVLCGLDEHRATKLLAPDREALLKWQTRFEGLGAIRSEGYERRVITEPVRVL